MPMPPLEIQTRDLALLSELVESRVMTVAHAAILHFGGRPEAAKKRIGRLKSAGFIRERKRKPYEPAVLFATRVAYSLLSEHGLLANGVDIDPGRLEKRSRVSDLTLKHELEVMDCKAALHSSLSASRHYEILEFATWPIRFQFHAAPAPGQMDVLVKPDAFLRILESAANGDCFEHNFFLELDRSTETQERIGQKASCYVDYYRRGGFAERHGRPPQEFKDYPFRVLMVFKNQERRNNAAEQLLSQTPAIKTQVWLTTFDEIKAHPLDAIWVQPLDYLRLFHEQGLTIAIPPRSNGYRRQIERELLVERLIPKHGLLD